MLRYPLGYRVTGRPLTSLPLHDSRPCSGLVTCRPIMNYNAPLMQLEPAALQNDAADIVKISFPHGVAQRLKLSSLFLFSFVASLFLVCFGLEAHAWLARDPLAYQAIAFFPPERASLFVGSRALYYAGWTYIHLPGLFSFVNYVPSFLVAATLAAMLLGPQDPHKEKSALDLFRLALSPPLRLPYFNLEADEGTCLWRALVASGFAPIDLVHANIYPWTTSFSRVDMAIFAQHPVLPWYYTFGEGSLGHVSVTPFTGARFGFRPHFARVRAFGATDGEPTVTGSYYSPPVTALGGAKPILTQVITMTKSSDFDTPWSWGLYPFQAIANRVKWTRNAQGTAITATRASEYVRHFPKIAGSLTRLPQMFTASLESEYLWRYVQAGAAQHLQVVTADKNWQPGMYAQRTLTQRAVDVGALLAGSYDATAIKSAQAAMAGLRFLSNLGNRLVPGWEASSEIRAQQLRQFVESSKHAVDYRYIATRLYMRLFAALLREHLNVERRRSGVRNADFDFQIAALGVNAPLTFINAVPPPPAVGGGGAPPPANPEAPMWTPDAQASLLDGRSQFLDVYGLTTPEIIELVSALDPMTQDNVPFLAVPQPQQPPAPIAAAAPDPANVPLPVDAGDAADYQGLWLNGLTRFVHAHAVEEIFLHSGNRVITPADQALIAANVHRAPNAVVIRSVIRQLAMLSDRPEDFDFGLQVALARFTTFSSVTAIGRRGNTRQDRRLYADGDQVLDLPRPYTSQAYFNLFFTPGELSADCEQVLAAQSHHIIHHASLSNHARASSLNWAAYASSCYGRIWQFAVGADPDPRIRNHTDAIRRVFGTDDLPVWSTLHANACAFQYGFCPPASVRQTESGSVIDLWDRYTTPLLVNPYLELWTVKFLPAHQVLPYQDDDAPIGVTFPPGQATPLPPAEAFCNNVRLARDRSPFAGFAWLNDGGITRNAQFYVAQPDNNGNYRFANGTGLQGVNLNRWNATLPYEMPAAPAPQTVRYLAAPGDAFADFIAPGSMLNFNIATSKQYAYAVSLADTAPTLVKQSWARLTQGEASQSLMVNYIHPFKQARAITEMPDYSALIWDRANGFAGLTVVRHDLPNFEVDARWDPPSVMAPRARSLFSPAQADPYAAEALHKRVTTVRAAPGARVASVRAPAATSPPSAPHGQTSIAYQSKGPNLRSQLPSNLEPVTVEVQDDGVAVRPTPSASRKKLLEQADAYEARCQREREDDLLTAAQIAEIDKEVEAQEQAYLAELMRTCEQREEALRQQRANRIAAARAQTLARELSQKRRATAPRPQASYDLTPRPRVKLPPPAAPADAAPSQRSPSPARSAPDTVEAVTAAPVMRGARQSTVGTVLGHLPKSESQPGFYYRKPVEPNDSAAGIIQNNAAKLRFGDFAPTPAGASPPTHDMSAVANHDPDDAGATPTQTRLLHEMMSDGHLPTSATAMRHDDPKN